jgi:Holliday junction resolvase RusA-like endonuclease
MADTRMSDPLAVLRFRVIGTPRPQGSGAMVTSRSTGRSFKKYAATSVHWRNIVIDALTEQHEDTEMIGSEVPVRVALEFRFARPKSHSQVRRHTDGRLKANGTDIDKLVRLMLDAMTVARIFDDDRQVCDLYATKRFCDDGEPEGVEVMVTTLMAP